MILSSLDSRSVVTSIPTLHVTTPDPKTDAGPHPVVSAGRVRHLTLTYPIRHASLPEAAQSLEPTRFPSDKVVTQSHKGDVGTNRLVQVCSEPAGLSLGSARI